jgi:rhodanese-related sulfurtransferase
MFFRQYESGCLSPYSYLEGDTTTSRAVVIPPFAAHGAGSACGQSMSSAPHSTIGKERRSNCTLAAMTEGAFVAAVIADQPLAPTYFPFAASTNRGAHELLDEERKPGAPFLDQVVRYQAGGAVVVDTRLPQNFASGHLERALNVSLDERFAEYAGDVIRPRQVLLDNMHQLDPDRPTLAVCGSGSRSLVAAWLLRAQGFASVADARGGFDACAAAGMPVAHPQS